MWSNPLLTVGISTPDSMHEVAADGIVHLVERDSVEPSRHRTLSEKPPLVVKWKTSGEGIGQIGCSTRSARSIAETVDILSRAAMSFGPHPKTSAHSY